MQPPSVLYPYNYLNPRYYDRPCLYAEIGFRKCENVARFSTMHNNAEYPRTFFCEYHALKNISHQWYELAR